MERKVILFILCIVIIGGVIKWYSNSQRSSLEITASAQKDETSQNDATSAGDNTELIIHIDGAVHRPGVYQLSVGSRIMHAIIAAGDTTYQADISGLNYAEPLRDGIKIYIPFLPAYIKSDIESMPENSAVTAGQSRPIRSPQYYSGNLNPAIQNKININTAGLDELATLPGIGPALSQRIIEYRIQYGPFRNIEQIKNVKGIADKRFEDIRDKITVY